MKHLNKILIVIINFLLLGLVTLIIKEQDQKKTSQEEASVTPLPQAVVDNQNAISANRESALRNVNTLPKQTKTTQITTQNTTTTTTPSRTTKTS